MGSVSSLKDRRVYLDTNIVIYVLERPSLYEDAIRPLLDAIARDECECVTAELTVTEVLPGVARSGDERAIDRCLQFFESGDVLELRPTSRDAFYKAGLFRSRTKASTPDALHLMTAVEHGCSTFLTNDKRLRSTEGVEVVQLSELRA